MRLLDGSGGSTKIAGIYAIWKNIVKNKGYYPDIISGVSASALLSVPFAMNKFKQLDEIIDNYDLETIFSKPPVTKSGSISFYSLFNILRGKDSLSTMDNLEKNLRAIVTEEDFKEYKKGSYPQCYIMAVGMKTGERRFIDVKEQTYEDYIKWTIASCSIPVFTNPVYIDGDYWFDGGLRDHSVAATLMIKRKDIKEVVSVFTRPMSCSNIILGWRPRNIINCIERSTSIMSLEISKNDQFDQIQMAKERKILLRQIFMPSILKSVYDVDRERVNELVEESIKALEYQWSH